jgi:opacity protein-like surface antigen
MRRKYIAVSVLLFSSSLAIAESASGDALHNFEISIGIGASYLTSNDGSLQPGSNELDKLSVHEVASSMVGKIGVGYRFSDQLSQGNFFKDWLSEINLYHVTGAIKGAVFQYQDPSLNNSVFQAPMSSTRLMLDIKPTVFAAQNFSTYPIFGIGVAENKLSYNSTTTNTNVPAVSINLNDNTNRRIAYDLGLGVDYRLTTHLKTSLEYLYQRVGNSSSSSYGSGASTYSAANFLVHSQNILMNLSYEF